ncbi:hypothetical protein T492DRAFT_849163 [Pavlovales sp. CCMP2436]|nr:hypothetical protein T492DRAFT_849163 [Pavlovales sp. CCMP2436]
MGTHGNFSGLLVGGAQEGSFLRVVAQVLQGGSPVLGAWRVSGRAEPTCKGAAEVAGCALGRDVAAASSNLSRWDLAELPAILEQVGLVRLNLLLQGIDSALDLPCCSFDRLQADKLRVHRYPRRVSWDPAKRPASLEQVGLLELRWRAWVGGGKPFLWLFSYPRYLTGGKPVGENRKGQVRKRPMV